MTGGKVLILHRGRFGRSVAERMARTHPVRAVDLIAALPALDDLVSTAEFVALALWRRCPEQTDTVDATCARRSVPWSSAVLDGRLLVAGPLVTPGRGACHACYRRRSATHRPRAEREDALDLLYDADPAAGAAGFPAAAVGLAAAALGMDRAELPTASGRLRVVDLLSGRTRDSRVVRVHGCPRCGVGPRDGRRFVTDLRAALGDGGP
jgi:bacteriocin biosynthesis cyclodehydratase domain-containing protein